MCGGRWRSAIQSTHTLPGADFGSDHELLVADVRLKLRKLTTDAQSLRYDMGKISTEYRLEISNRFQAIDLVMREPDELWMEIKEEVKTTTKAHACASAEEETQFTMDIRGSYRDSGSKKEGEDT